ncbi:WD40-repeat-containing domain protein [Phycomyces blakesleeanus]|uniref:WD40-repeat-containing domain protein n=1 Tax=Phycomyces blakesleeanus TaxID=4837 RepID=A0ABR3B2H1_PHYBL
MEYHSDFVEPSSPPITKETRKLRKKKVFLDDELSNEESDEVVTDEDSVDQVDTDDLLEEAESVPPFRPTLVKRKVKAKRRAVQPKKKAAVTPQKAKVDKGKKVKKKVEYIPEQVKQLAAEFPDNYWKFHADTSYDMIDTINEDCPLQSIPCNMSDQAPITSMSISPDGTLLATFSNVGAIKIWDIEDDFRMVRKLRDMEEMHIDEFYCGKFVSESQALLVTGGKLKDRHRFSVQDEDNHILPCPIKVFDIQENKVLSRLDGHMEEILCIKALMFKNENYYISTSQDGYIIKWHMDSNWSTLLDSTRMEDGITCMAFTVSFLPNTGNKYFMGACDEHLRLYDFEEAQLLQTFEDMYSSYCDCGKFVKWLDAAAFESARKNEDDAEEMIDVVSCDENEDMGYAWFISRGAEMCDVSEGVSSLPNSATLHKLIYPTETGGKFVLEQIKKYKHEDYHANSWLVKVTSNGRYLLAPTIYGQIFVFNMFHGQLTAILKDHEDVEVRDVIFHPYRPLIFSNGCVKVYSYKNLVTDDIEADLLVGKDST